MQGPMLFNFFLSRNITTDLETPNGHAEHKAIVKGENGKRTRNYVMKLGGCLILKTPRRFGFQLVLRACGVYTPLGPSSEWAEELLVNLRSVN